MVRTVVNKDGSITTSSEDEHVEAVGAPLVQAKVVKSAKKSEPVVVTEADAK